MSTSSLSRGDMVLIVDKIRRCLKLELSKEQCSGYDTGRTKVIRVTAKLKWDKDHYDGGQSGVISESHIDIDMGVE